MNISTEVWIALQTIFHHENGWIQYDIRFWLRCLDIPPSTQTLSTIYGYYINPQNHAMKGVP